MYYIQQNWNSWFVEEANFEHSTHTSQHDARAPAEGKSLVQGNGIEVQSKKRQPKLFLLAQARIVFPNQLAPADGPGAQLIQKI